MQNEPQPEIKDEKRTETVDVKTSVDITVNGDKRSCTVSFDGKTVKIYPDLYFGTQPILMYEVLS